MPQETIKVVEAKGPVDGKKRGRLKSEDGRIFQAMPVIIDSVRLGSLYDIGYKDDEYNGVKFRVIESLAPSIGGIPQRPMPSGQGVTGGSQIVHTDDRGTDIATLAIAKVWLEKVPVGDEVGCLHALRVARRAWLKFKNNPDNVDSHRSPPVDDEVPYDR